MEQKNNNDLFNNPMVDAARKAMTPEQIEEYKKVGEYMYNSVDYRIKEIGSKVKSADKNDLVEYASQALNSGLDPHDLSSEELRALIEEFGEDWYTHFDYKKEEVPQPTVQLVSPQDAIREIQRQSQTLNRRKKRRHRNKRK